MSGCRICCASCRRRSTSTRNLLSGNPIWISRTQGVGHLSAADGIALGRHRSPRCAPAAWTGISRRDMPYSGYEKFQFKVPISDRGDVWARYVIRLDEMRESIKICQQALDGMPTGPLKADAPKIVLPDREKMKTEMEALIYHFKIVTEGFPRSRRRGLSGHRVAPWRDGLLTSSRMARPSPTAYTCAIHLSPACRRSMPCARGRLLADVVAVIGSIDIVLGGDRPLSVAATSEDAVCAGSSGARSSRCCAPTPPRTD